MAKQKPSIDVSDDPAGRSTGQRLDKWLWFARLVKSRTMASGLVADGKVRVNRERVAKPSQAVRAGDVITVTVHRMVRVLKVRAPGVRRGPATEAAMLYEDLTPPPDLSRSNDGITTATGGPYPRTGRPTKKDRRAIDRLRGDG